MSRKPSGFRSSDFLFAYVKVSVKFPLFNYQTFLDHLNRPHYFLIHRSLLTLDSVSPAVMASDKFVARHRHGHARQSSIPRATPNLYNSKDPPALRSTSKLSEHQSPSRLPKSKTTSDLSPTKVARPSALSERSARGIVTPQRTLMAPLGPPLPMLSSLPGALSTSPGRQQITNKAEFSSPGKVDGAKEVEASSRGTKLTQDEAVWFDRQNEETIRARTTRIHPQGIVTTASKRRGALPPDFQKSSEAIYQYPRRPMPGPYLSHDDSSTTLANQSLSDSESSADTNPGSPSSQASISSVIEGDPRTIYFPMPTSYFLGRLSTLLDKQRYEDAFSPKAPVQQNKLQTPPKTTIAESHEHAEIRRINLGIAELRTWCKTEEALRSFNIFTDQYYTQQRRKLPIARPTNYPHYPAPIKSNLFVVKTPPPPPLPQAPTQKSHGKFVLRSNESGDRRPNGNTKFGGLVKSKTMGSLRRLPSMSWGGRHKDSSTSGTNALKSKDIVEMPLLKTPQTATKRVRRPTIANVDGPQEGNTQPEPRLRRRHTSIGRVLSTGLPNSATTPMTSHAQWKSPSSKPSQASLSCTSNRTSTSPTPAATPKTPKSAASMLSIGDHSQSQKSEGSSRKSSGTIATYSNNGAEKIRKVFAEGGRTLRRVARSFTGSSDEAPAMSRRYVASREGEYGKLHGQGGDEQGQGKIQWLGSGDRTVKLRGGGKVEVEEGKAEAGHASAERVEGEELWLGPGEGTVRLTSPATMGELSEEERESWGSIYGFEC